MLALGDKRWAALSHAYGSAGQISDLLARAAQDLRPGHQQDSTWFDLWSALCHQGDIFTASYAAVPHLVALAPAHLQRKNYDPLLLSASIELARLEGRAPEIPADLSASYYQAVATARTLAEQSVSIAWDRSSDRAIRGSAAALAGDIDAANTILNRDDHEI